MSETKPEVKTVGHSEKFSLASEKFSLASEIFSKLAKISDFSKLAKIWLCLIAKFF